MGNQTVVMEDPPEIITSYTVVGPMEGQGPLGGTFDRVWKDSLNQEQSWEKAESKMMEDALQGALTLSGIQQDQIDFQIGGDLLNQLISTHFAARSLGFPLIGLYGACSTMALSTALAGMLIDGHFARYVMVGVSSHHDTAERQYRMPTEHGNQRMMSAQWTVTGAASLLLGRSATGIAKINGAHPKVTAATIGRVVDLGVKDTNNMGAAMAPAVADTILNHLQDMKRQPSDYDLILSGDLGEVGWNLVKDILRQSKVKLGDEFADCGRMIYGADQDVHAGASGCGCSGVVFAGDILQKMRLGKLRRVLFVGSGALHSPISCFQGESIPGIGHAVVIET
jgi:stage V sporulation protein AD